MKGTQIALGVSLLGVSGATIAASSLVGGLLAGLLPVAAAVVGTVALAIGVDAGSDRRRTR